MARAGGEERIVIVGGGPAAQAAAGAYREAGGSATMTILAREADPPYERPPLTKDFLRGEAGRGELQLVDRDWYQEHGIELRAGVEAAELDLGAAEVRDAEG
ncbi:MAG: 3-phenylpropionate/trans-cinnamate dioxygenase ferredoxin reductase component, partial [Solirubrobacterales bacterium]|nr:3-phenylpropionate/trans-cinnamate dioxygenase ferredoxin reductase component [Solirubrobacterales bacterium]